MSYLLKKSTPTEKGIEDFVAVYLREVNELNEGFMRSKYLLIGERSLSSNIGYFLPKAMFDFLGMDNDISCVASTFNARCRFSEMIRALCYAQIVSPCSSSKRLRRLFRGCTELPGFSYDQIPYAVRFIGSDYHKYIEVLNHHIARR